jgi:hypothetical protein
MEVKMPDPAFAEEHRNVGYSDAVSFELSATPGLLYPLVGSTDNYSGQGAHRIDNRFDDVEMEIQTGRNEDTNLTDPDSLVRFIKARPPRDVAIAIDKNDQKLTQVDLGSPIAKQIAKAARRVHDDEWLVGYFGNAWTGENGDVAVPFPAANIVANGATGFTKAKLIALRQLMIENDVDFEAEMPVILLAPQQQSDLLGIDEYINSDYQDGHPLVRGEIKPWLGFRFIGFNPDSPKAYKYGGALTKTGNVRSLPAFLPSGLHRGVWTEFLGRMGERADKKYNMQVYGEARSAVVRTNEDLTYLLEAVEP